MQVVLNGGEPIAKDEDLFGRAVNEAARITATAKGVAHQPCPDFGELDLDTAQRPVLDCLGQA